MLFLARYKRWDDRGTIEEAHTIVEASDSMAALLKVASIAQNRITMNEEGISLDSDGSVACWTSDILGYGRPAEYEKITVAAAGTWLHTTNRW